MKRAAFILLIALVIAGVARMAFAQSGACPPGTVAMTPPSPSGTWPSDTLICRDIGTEGDHLEIYDENGYACEEQGVKGNDLWGLVEWQPRVVYVPPAGRNIVDEDGYTRFRFEFWSYNFAGNADDEMRIKVEYWGPDNVRRSWKTFAVGNYTMVTAPTPIQVIIPQYYNVFLIDEEILADVSDGYFTVRPLQERDIPGSADMTMWYIAGWQAGAPDDNFPPFCPIPGGTIPSTPTPAPPTATLPPTFTPVGTYETPTPSRTPTPYTPAATSPGGTPNTPFPTNTPTAIVYSTLPPEPTVTPWPTYVFPTIVFATAAPPNIEPINTPPPLTWQQTPDPTAEYQLEQIENWTEDISIMATRWHTTTSYALTFDPDTAMPITSTVPITSEFLVIQPGVNAPTLLPTSSGESPTIREWLMNIPDNVAVIAGYIKSPQFYMPHFWPLFFFLLVAFAIILFITAFRFAMKMALAAYKFFGWHIEKIPVVE